MSDRQTNSNRPGPAPRIPSNLRIRRLPRLSSSYGGAILAADGLQANEEGQQRPAIFEQDYVPQARPAYGTGSRRGSSRRLGVVESLAMNDRITSANAARSSGAPHSVADPSSNTTNTNAEQTYGNDRQRLLNAGAGRNEGRLPALEEVASPEELQQTPGQPPSPMNTEYPTPSGTLPQMTNASRMTAAEAADYFPSRRSAATQNAHSSVPLRPILPGSASAPAADLPKANEGSAGENKSDTLHVPPSSGSSGGNRLSRMISNISIPTPLSEERSPLEDSEHHAAEVADYLDVIDAEVGTLGYLTNVQNSIFVPNIPSLYDRRPVHDLPRTKRRGSTITSLANRTSRRASQAESEGAASQRRGSQDRRSITSDLEQARPGSADQGAVVSRSRPPSVLSRVASYVPGRKKEETVQLNKHIKEWEEMDEEERNELDEHVRLVLSKKSKLHRGLKGFYAFVKTPMGFIMTLYGFLITFWGTAIMLFIFGWIHVGERRRYWIEICDQILCALFAAVGLGFAPFRAVDTYRMIWIAKMHYRTWERRKQLGLQDLQDPNDLPRPEEDGSNQVSRVVKENSEATRHVIKSRTAPVTRSGEGDLEKGTVRTNELSEVQARHWWDLKRGAQANEETLEEAKQAGNKVAIAHDKKNKQQFIVPEQTLFDPSGKTGDLRRRPPVKRNDSIKSELVKEKEDIVVLTKEEQALLSHHQRKFHASHTFYRFHETATHRAFPLDLMITIVCLLDCHSMLQAALGGCTWGIKYTHRPTALTASLITCSLSCNAMAGLLIYIGGRKTKKREEVERRLRIALETMALAKIERRRARGELPVRPDGDQSKGSHSSPDPSIAGVEEDSNGSQAEFGAALNAAARQTEEEDQRQYDEPDDEQHQQHGHPLQTTGTETESIADANIVKHDTLPNL